MVDVGCGPDRKTSTPLHSTPPKRCLSESLDDDAYKQESNEDYNPVNDPDLSDIRYIYLLHFKVIVTDYD